MAISPEFSNLLDKYGLDHDLPSDVLVDVARQKLVFAPSNFEAYVLAYGQIPETYQEFVTIVEFVRSQQEYNDRCSLAEALRRLNKAGKTI